MQSLYSKFRNKLSSLFSSLGTKLTYGILKPCYRCTYQKSNEPILIVSQRRGPRIIVKLNNITYVRNGECLGYNICGKCFDLNRKDCPCIWMKV